MSFPLYCAQGVGGAVSYAFAIPSSMCAMRAIVNGVGVFVRFTGSSASSICVGFSAFCVA